MPRTRRFLRRFRLAAAPGAAAAVGVPADRAAEAAAELAPVFAELEPVHVEAERLRAAAGEQAEEIRRRTADEAAAALAAAHDRAGRERAAAGLAATERLDREREQALRAARLEADRIRRTTAVRMPGYVERVVDQVHGLLTEDPGRAAGP